MLIACAWLNACDTGGDRCQRYFDPFPDIVSGRAPTGSNARLLEAMTRYSAGDHAGAVEGLRAHAEQYPQEADIAWFYLANCYLALGKPFDAELQLDHLERWPARTFRDEGEWYSMLCLLCSAQDDRALEAARIIVAKPRHTYHDQAVAVVEELEP